jgi:hypothetical protein
MSVLEARREQSEKGLQDIRAALAPAASLFAANRVALYVTGSFGRLEARYPQGSDLDVFFVYMTEDRDPETDLSRLVWFELIATVINAARELKFEPFSRDGAFLKPHNVFRLGSELGSRHEDAENGFTARLLLLLEGRYLANADLYSAVLLEAIGFYYDDFPDKRERFRPYALLNDILRYWRTLCLNYEHQRGRKRRAAGDDEAQLAIFTAESALDNLKLRYSRLALCFSMIALLVSEPQGIPPERIRELCAIAPTDRWTEAAKRDSSGGAEAIAVVILERYEEFLALVADEEQVLARLQDQDERRALRVRATEFGDRVFDLVKLVSVDDQFRRLVV